MIAWARAVRPRLVSRFRKSASEEQLRDLTEAIQHSPRLKSHVERLSDFCVADHRHRLRLKRIHCRQTTVSVIQSSANGVEGAP